MSYDTWLEAPYIEQAQEAELHEMFQASADYADAFQDWLDTEYAKDDDDD